ncbi:ABC transporter ATP-binding protein [Archangium gephyra]|uniref:ABC transporter ATP-binding protein n=1 Tax=Archangium gephyra TaxID=48 RepID=UPI0035D4AC44
MLTISRLSKRYANGVRALDGVSLNIGTGLFGLLGPNGAGKSTLMRTLATLQEPDEGEILFDGCNVLAEPQRVRHQLGYLPQDFGVYPGVPAVQLLDHLAVLKGLTHRGERTEQVDALLQLTNLYEVRKKDVSTFSGGMKQRFGIAQALLGSPRLLIVDEPTAGLDPEERNRFHNLLSEVGESVVVILSTHIVEDVRDLCSRMAILAGGRILLEGEPERLVEQLEGRVWRKTIPKASVADHRAAHTVISTHLYGGKTRIHVLSDTSPGSGFDRITPDLEDVYFSALPGQPPREERVAC